MTYATSNKRGTLPDATTTARSTTSSTSPSPSRAERRRSMCSSSARPMPGSRSRRSARVVAARPRRTVHRVHSSERCPRRSGLVAARPSRTVHRVRETDRYDARDRPIGPEEAPGPSPTQAHREIVVCGATPSDWCNAVRCGSDTSSSRSGAQRNSSLPTPARHRDGGTTSHGYDPAT